MKRAPRLPAWPWWLWLSLAVGAGLRAFLVVATPGTDDVPIWQTHGGWTWEYGLVGYYERSDVFNHPPFIARVMEGLWLVARDTGVPFRLLLRAPFALLDLGSALLLLALFREEATRHLAAAAYALHPLGILFSAYHGNTDAAVAFFMLLAVLAAARGRAALAGVALGLGLWVKLPVLVASPALFFALPDARQRLQLVAATLGVALLTYLPVLVLAPGPLFESVFAYGGRSMATRGGTPIWGIWGVVGGGPQPLVDLHREWNTAVCGIPILALAWLRRRERSARGLGTTVCASLLLLFGLTNNLWAFQYLAWIAPFLLFPGCGFAAVATLLLGGYAYGVYAYLTGSAFLLGRWDFGGTPDWPWGLVRLRDAGVLFCLIASLVFLVGAVHREVQARRAARS